MNLPLLLLSLVFLFADPASSSSVADPVCQRKKNEGVALGTVFEVPETCEKCACDGALRMFCMVDPVCKRNKEALNRQPCYRGGSKFEHGGQVQVDCNICTCNNRTWDCTTADCNYGSGEPEPARNTDPNCQDLDDRCEKWVKRKGKEVCSSKKYIEKKCIRSCDTCPSREEVAVETQKKEKEVCEDKNDNCAAWAKREDGNLCRTHKFMKTKCRATCGLCKRPNGGEKEETNEVVEEEEEEVPREKTAAELEEERRQAEIDAWRNRLIEDGQLVDTNKTPQGCMFDCGGTIYPWGSSLQDSHCGVCECKRKGKHNYFFRCTNRECETNPTNCN